MDMIVATSLALGYQRRSRERLGQPEQRIQLRVQGKIFWMEEVRRQNYLAVEQLIKQALIIIAAVQKFGLGDWLIGLNKCGRNTPKRVKGNI